MTIRKTVSQGVILFFLSSFAAPVVGQGWPQASGPQGNYQAEGKEPPARWSVSTGESIFWRQRLPECGQSGIAVVRDRLFLTVKKPLPEGASADGATTADVVGLCLDAGTGKILWDVAIPGKRPGSYVELFVSEPTPIADDSRVWFTNSAGGMMCVDHSGKEIWRRVFDVEPLHQAKFYQPLLVDGKLVHVELKGPITQQPKLGKNSGMGPWMFLRAYDPATGKPLWTAEGGTSIFSSPGLGKLGDQSVLFHGRGGPHNPPETPYGFTLTRAATGENLWNREVKSGMSFFISHVDGRFAYAFDVDKLLALDLKTGRIEREFPLKANVDWHHFNSTTGKTELKKDAKIPGGKKHPSYHSNILVGRHMLFMAHDNPSIGRVNLDTGKVEYLQVPYQVDRNKKAEKAIWDQHLPATPTNSRDVKFVPDRRVQGNGWGHVTVPSPIAVNGKVYFVTMLGTVYVVDAGASQLDSKALRWVGDLGPARETWTLAPLAYANGRLYARTLKEVVCIGQ